MSSKFKVYLLFVAFSYGSAIHAADMNAPRITADKIKAGAAEVAQVRIQLKLVPQHQVQIKTPNGELITQSKPGEEMKFTLRAKMNTTNHFHFAGYHVESNPIEWKAEVREYAVALNFYKVSSLSPDVEDKLGSMIVKGHLVNQSERVYNLVAHSEIEFKDLQGDPLLAVVAGTELDDQSIKSSPLISRQ